MTPTDLCETCRHVRLIHDHGGPCHGARGCDCTKFWETK